MNIKHKDNKKFTRELFRQLEIDEFKVSKTRKMRSDVELQSITTEFLNQKIQNELSNHIELILKDSRQFNSTPRVELQIGIYSILKEIVDHVRQHGAENIDISPLVDFVDLVGKRILNISLKSQIYNGVDLTTYNLHSIYYTISVTHRLHELIQAIKYIEQRGRVPKNIQELTGVQYTRMKHFFTDYEIQKFMKEAIYAELENLSHNMQDNLEFKKRELRFLKNNTKFLNKSFYMKSND